MRIAIDGITFSHPQPGGYRTYTTNLVAHLMDGAPEQDFLLILDRPVERRFPPNWRVEIMPGRLPVVGVAVREQVTLPMRVGRRDANVLHSPCATGPVFSPCPQVVTLLDTIEFSTALPSMRTPRMWAMRVYSRLVQSAMARKAKAVVTLSTYSKRKIVERFRIPPDRVQVIHLAPASGLTCQDRSAASALVRERWGLDRYLLALASASRRKNTPFLLEAYARTSSAIRNEYSLVLVFSHAAQRDRVLHRAVELGIRDNVLALDRVSDSELASLYAAAALFVFPSLEEGFGLPPLEAMSCGTPVIASNTSSLPEVLGDAALLVPPVDVSELVGAIESVLTDRSLAEALVGKGQVRCQAFSWTRTARQTLDVYRAVAAIG